MPRTREGASQPLTPELMLRKATLAKTAGLRAKYAQRGLKDSGPVDPSTQTLLLRQLYLSLMERREFEQARGVADQMIALQSLLDVAHQDAARAYLGLRDIASAVRHVRLAARLGPPSRRAFHFWTLGSIQYLNGMPAEGVRSLTLAARWGTRDKPLYRAQLALACAEAQQSVPPLAPLLESLEQAPCGQGYGQYVAGELCMLLGRESDAATHFRSFVTRVTSGRVALSVGLFAEIARARRHLMRMGRKRAKG